MGGKRQAQDVVVDQVAKRLRVYPISRILQGVQLARPRRHPNLTDLPGSSKWARLYSVGNPLIVPAHNNALKSMAISDSGVVASSDIKGNFKFWTLNKKNSDPLVLSREAVCQDGYAEDFAWHPDNKRLFTVYKFSSPGQVVMLDASSGRFSRLEDKPHHAGTLRCIKFMPWTVCGAPAFATCGDDHAVVIWSESEDKWTCQRIHTKHNSSVYGVVGSVVKEWVLSASLDKHLRIFDVAKGVSCCESKFSTQLLGLHMNPRDPNLLMLVGCGVAHEQITLHDLRCLDNEKALQEYGWPLNNSTVTGKIQQCWSPDGMYMSTGSLENKFHIYDIRHNSKLPTHTITGQFHMVVKAQWHSQVERLVISATRGGDFWLQELS